MISTKTINEWSRKMKVLEFLKVFKDPYVLFPLYLTKSIILSFGMVDFWILGVISFVALSEKLLDKAHSSVSRYFDTKDKVLSENEFRTGVNADMSKLVEEVNMLKVINGSKNGMFGGAKR